MSSDIKIVIVIDDDNPVYDTFKDMTEEQRAKFINEALALYLNKTQKLIHIAKNASIIKGLIGDVIRDIAKLNS
jgi:hypothetical protein